jgi:hypothetical protein
MGFVLNLGFLSEPDPGTDPVGPQGLDLAVEAIDSVIKRIEDELAVLEPTKFASDGTIQKASFGGGDAAPNLALHYSRAHEVIAKTLLGVKEDLVTFQDACRNAKNEIVATDEDVAQQQNQNRAAVEILQAGVSPRDSSAAHQQAQQNQDVNGGGDI